MLVYEAVQQNEQVRESRRGHRELRIQRKWQHWVHKTEDEDTENYKDEQHGPHQNSGVKPGDHEGQAVPASTCVHPRLFLWVRVPNLLSFCVVHS
jgi:endonuclease/exonuclease/phosphatase family metal-dependent hydrolase